MKRTTNVLDLDNLPLLIHQAALNPYQNLDEFNKSCDQAKYFSLGGFCSDLSMISLARERLGKKSNTKLIATIAFPFGSLPSNLKKSQAEWAISEGAEELEVVPNFFTLSQSKTDLFAEELASICEIGLPVRVIINASNLSSKTLEMAIEASIEAGAISIQSGNGFGRAVTIDDIRQIKDLTKGRCSIKAVGSIKTLKSTIDLIEAGADMIGTTVGSSLIEELREQKK